MGETPFVPLEQAVLFFVDLNRANDNLQIPVAFQNAALTFRFGEIVEADAKRQNEAQLKLVKADVVAKKMFAEMPPAVGEQLIYLRSGNARAIKFFVDKAGQIFEHKPEKIYEIQLADENLRGVPPPVRVAQALGERLESGEILLGTLPPQQADAGGKF